MMVQACDSCRRPPLFRATSCGWVAAAALPRKQPGWVRTVYRFARIHQGPLGITRVRCCRPYPSTRRLHAVCQVYCFGHSAARSAETQIGCCRETHESNETFQMCVHKHMWKFSLLDHAALASMFHWPVHDSGPEAVLGINADPQFHWR